MCSGIHCFLFCTGSNCLARQYCGALRPFEMTITDNAQREVRAESGVGCVTFDIIVPLHHENVTLGSVCTLHTLHFFLMSTTHITHVQVIHLVRPYRCMSCLCFCCLQKIEVQSPPGTVIGYIQQDCSFVYPWFSVLNAEEETVLKIKGPCWTCKFCEAEFEVRERVCRHCLFCKPFRRIYLQGGF